MEGFEHNPSASTDEYEAEWASVIDDAITDPAVGLYTLLDIVERMLRDYRSPLAGEAVTAEGVDPLVRAGLDVARNMAASSTATLVSTRRIPDTPLTAW